ncbi:MAG: nucleotidyl transferase AbiEii/AbiGii toxin family protein [Phycisphaerae bacterium]|nr:nucleotidyl transferase AbiEii/AbiGii toxin family protein [Phycisphaerae bacterium]
MDIEQIDQIKRTAVIALFSDDDLMDALVLKGGNALDIVYDIAQRSSLDLDFSIPTDFKTERIPEITKKIRRLLWENFRDKGYEAFDIDFREVPEHATTTTPDFWGGYLVEFKVIEIAKYKGLLSEPRALRTNALEAGPGHQRKFKISISKFEHCSPKKQVDLDDYTVYVYTPEMIVFEKLRAICQQMPEYVPNSTKTARARDFFDIHTVMEHFTIELASPRNIDLLKNIFDAKEVPLPLIGKIAQYREYHRPDFTSVEATLKPNIELNTFDFYFDYLVDRCKCLKSLWEM